MIRISHLFRSFSSASSSASSSFPVSTVSPLAFTPVPLHLRSHQFPLARKSPSTLLNCMKQAYEKRKSAFQVKYFSGINDYLDGLYKAGFIGGYRNDTNTGTITVKLRYSPEGRPSLGQIHFLSKPSFRRHVDFSEKMKELDFYPFSILILKNPTGVEFASKGQYSHHGGELVARIE